MNIFTFLQWLWAILLGIGVPLMIIRPVMLQLGKKKALTDRTKAWIWFLQVLGFWAVVIGGWMKVEATIPQLLEEEEDEDEGDAKKDDEKDDDEDEKKDDDE